jgi:hypothetical protein
MSETVFHTLLVVEQGNGQKQGVHYSQVTTTSKKTKKTKIQTCCDSEYV